MLRKLAMSASALALAGGLSVAQAETMTNPSSNPSPSNPSPSYPSSSYPPSGRSMSATAASSLSTPHWLASDIYKADVYDNAQDKIGTVTDLVMDSNGDVTTAVVSVGGFLGVGAKDVAVPFDALKVQSRNGKDWLVLNETKDQLKATPAFDKTSQM
ncbi:MAG: PRC-barrel domain-containing protein [Methylocella sp.]